MADDALGPNGGMLYALQEVETNFDWLREGLKRLGGRRCLEVVYSWKMELNLFTFYMNCR